MRTLLFRCPEGHGYTLSRDCPACGGRTVSPLPPRYSPEDRYGRYRRALQERA